ncbi:hypothetical protein HMPREF1084_01955 [Clostridium butyricum 60E.3]|uniref:hypothetical protein n=1 Tax=Clostridium butyricum TaxID=1492 RepID=UPI0002D1E427|nr:hypothetical protein [Clostridium butyricum]ALP91197.1 hypothetical protein ATN24_13960 [Clostridium butyricum]ANF14820.1 hypothetical protein AZ909_12415 [Clostridium butyricum]ENZ33486.1 hypothetical protein HMPREF1084_01955 [Clostridium butyricum 60E.3]MCI3009049.1 hypothetical protein [Clostridium butyricum]MDP0841112.1 hypothetical protein [Clostridium butyricum]
MAEQLSMLEETIKEKTKKMMKQALSKGIIPGAEVILDGDKDTIYRVGAIYLGHDYNLEVRLYTHSGNFPIGALSNRLTVL